MIKRSSLPGLQTTSAKLFLASAEFDPGIANGKPSVFNQALHDELCKLDGANATDGQGHCPTLAVMKGESHMSELFSVDTRTDNTVSGASRRTLADGKGHCPMLVVMKGESHMSEIFSVDTSDKTVSGAVLAWIKSVQ